MVDDRCGETLVVKLLRGVNMNTTERAAAPQKYPQVIVELNAVEAKLKALRETLHSGKTLKYKDVEAIGHAVASLVSRGASACW